MKILLFKKDKLKHLAALLGKILLLLCFLWVFIYSLSYNQMEEKAVFHLSR